MWDGTNELAGRKRATAALLGAWCDQLVVRAPEISAGTWAIVGGAVRDSLFDKESGQGQFWSWPDLDFAVSDASFNGLVDLNERDYTVRRNTFGGLKVHDPQLGVLDIWRADLQLAGEDSTAAWTHYLDRVDFSVNAVAFVWPERVVLIHPEWVRDVQQLRVRKLKPTNLARELAPIRAIAVAAKMQHLTGATFRLGQESARDFRWLTHSAKGQHIGRALDYLCDKVRSGRWPQSVLERLEVELEAKPAGDRFARAYAARG